MTTLEIVTDGNNYDNSAYGIGRVGNWMQTYSGKQFWPMDPKPEEIDIEDIAHALSNACRYAGHCEFFYSVAEHSLHVMNVLPQELKLAGLLHDATEAYLVDVPRPIKPFLTNYKEIEDRLWSAIATRFGIPVELPKEIKLADNAVLLAEAAQIMKAPPAPWCLKGEPANISTDCWRPNQAKERFLSAYCELTR